MSDPLERNLAALLARYRPVRPAPSFRDRLDARLAAAGGAARPQPAPRRVSVALAAAAVLLVGLGLALLSRPADPAPVHGDPASILGTGRHLAVRDAPDAPWEPRRSARQELRAGAAYLEVATPRGHGAALVAGGSRAELAERSRASLRWDADGRPILTLGFGAVDLEGAWHLASSEAALRVAGSTRVAYRDARGVARAFEQPVDRSRPLLEVELGAPRRAELLRADAEPLALPAGIHHLQDGRLLRPVLVAADAGARRAGAAAPPAAPGVAAGTGHLRGSVLDHQGRPAAEFLLWTRVEVHVPEVAVPVAHEFAAGRFELDLPPATYTVLVELPGHAAWTVRGLELAAGQELDLPVALERGGRVSGYVVDAQTSAPLEGALVLAEFDQPHQVVDLTGAELERRPLASALTDSAGRYELEHLSFGRHHLRISAPGHAPAWTAPFDLARPEPPDERAARPQRVLPHTALGTGGRVEGRIERADGLPWPGANVVLSMVAMEGPQPVYTFGAALADATGRYEVEHLPEGYYVALDLVGPGGTPRSVHQTQVRAGETTTVDFLAPRQEARVFGRLTDAGGRALAGYSISLAPDPERGSFQGWTATTTDGDGHFEFAAVVPGEYGLFVSPRVDSMTRRARVVVPQVAEHRLDVSLPNTALEGVLGCPPGSDPRGVNLILMRRVAGEAVFQGRQAVESDGRFRFAGLEPGEYQVAAVGRDAPLGSVVADPQQVEADATVRVALELRPGGRVSLTVVDPEGRPVAHARVWIADGAGRPLPFTPDPFTDLDGRVRMPSLAPGEWTISAARDGQDPGARTVSRTLEVAAGDELTLQLELPR